MYFSLGYFAGADLRERGHCATWQDYLPGNMVTTPFDSHPIWLAPPAVSTRSDTICRRCKLSRSHREIMEGGAELSLQSTISHDRMLSRTKKQNRTNNQRKYSFLVAAAALRGAG